MWACESFGLPRDYGAVIEMRLCVSAWSYNAVRGNQRVCLTCRQNAQRTSVCIVANLSVRSESVQPCSRRPCVRFQNSCCEGVLYTVDPVEMFDRCMWTEASPRTCESLVIYQLGGCTPKAICVAMASSMVLHLLCSLHVWHQFSITKHVLIDCWGPFRFGKFPLPVIDDIRYAMCYGHRVLTLFTSPNSPLFVSFHEFPS